jgi:hypothetical protein
MTDVRERARELLRSQAVLPVLWIALTIVTLIPVWHHRLLPMLDMPNHLALARGWHNYYDPAWHIADFYDLRIRPVPYLLYYASVHLLMFAFSIETANKLYLSAYLIFFPLSVAYLAHALKRSPWLALCSLPLAFNQSWPYGFTSYLMGPCFMFVSLAALVLYLRDGSRRHLVLIAVGTVAAYSAHPLPWIMSGVGAIGLLLLDWRNWRRGLAAASALAPSVVLAIAAALGERSERGYLKSHDAFEGLWRDPRTAAIEFPKRVLDIIPSHFDMWVLVVLALTVLGLSVLGRRDPPLRETRHLTLLLCLFGLAYFALPTAIIKPVFWTHLSARIAAMVAPMILLWPTARLHGWRVLLLLPALAASVALPIQLDHLYAGFNGRNAPFIALVDRLPIGTSTLVVYRGIQRTEEKTEDPASSIPVYAHFTSWPMALKGGFNPYAFYQGIPITPRAPLQAPSFLGLEEFALHQAPRFDYYLVHDAPPSMDHEPALTLEMLSGRWKLYRRVGEITAGP